MGPKDYFWRLPDHGGQSFCVGKPVCDLQICGPQIERMADDIKTTGNDLKISR